jgi:arylsulfatase A-like enzyme
MKNIFAVALILLATTLARAADRPNFVWIVSEDNSKHYQKLFDANGAPTPNIDKLATEGLIYTHAFSNAPVCSVARSTLALSVLAPRICTHFHRKIKTATLPKTWKPFSVYLKETGYYTTNNSKTDYNFTGGKGIWNESSRKASWQKRKKGQPFYHMESHAVSHEGQVFFSPNKINPGSLKTKIGSFKLHPYFPDTPLFQYTQAFYMDKQIAIDKIVGKTVAKLEKDGLMDDTFIFYFGDHGGVLPRSKGYIYESGLHVPLVIRVPKNFRHLVDFNPGSKVGGFVSFIDFGPTLLKLAGVDVPTHMDGKPFLGKGITADEVNARDETFGYADRFDEKYEMIRSLRKGKFKYIRNYQGYYPDGLQNNYRYKMAAFSKWRELYRAGKLTGAPTHFFLPKPAESLYDIDADPHEINNLAADPKHAKTLVALRDNLRARMKALPDLSLYPESELIDNALGDPIAYGKKHAAEIAELLDVADLAVLPFDEAKPKIEAAFKSDNRWKRYWAATACAVYGKTAATLADAATPLLKDSELLVRVRAAEFLGILKHTDPRPTIMGVLKEAKSPTVSLITLNAAVFLQDGAPGYKFSVASDQVSAQDSQVKRRLLYLK